MYYVYMYIIWSTFPINIHDSDFIAFATSIVIIYDSFIELVLFLDFQMRCPHGKKTKLYKKAKLEKFAHYLMKDGLVSRLSIYGDKECMLKPFDMYFYVTFKTSMNYVIKIIYELQQLF